MHGWSEEALSQGTGAVTGRKYVEPKHGPQYVPEAPKDFPRVVNGVPTTGSGDEPEQRPSIPPSPSAPLRKTGVHKTISGSQMDLSELAAIMEKATLPKSERSSLDCSRSSTGRAFQPPLHLSTGTVAVIFAPLWYTGCCTVDMRYLCIPTCGGPGIHSTPAQAN